MNQRKLLFLGFTVILFLASCHRPLSIDNKPTVAYVSLQNSKIDLLLPQGFSLATDFKGAESDDGTANIRADEFDKPVSEFIKGYSKQVLADNNIAVTDSLYMKINGLSAWLFHGYSISGEKAFSKWLIITGDDSGSALLAGNILKTKEKELNEPVKKSLLSIIYYSHRKLKPIPRIRFAFDNSTGLRAAGEKMAMLVYTDDGAMPDSTRLRNTMYVSRGPSKPDPGEDLLQYSEEIIYFSSPSMGSIGIDSSREIPNPNFTVYEVVGHGVDSVTNQKAVIYQATTFYGKNFFMLKGVFTGNVKKMIGAFRETAISLKQTTE